jgi:hypothetical protein
MACHHLVNLAVALLTRYEHFGDLDDLEEGIPAERKAVRMASPGDPSLPRLLTDLGIMLRLYFERTYEPAALTEAVSWSREAVQVTAPDDPRLAGRTSNLSVALQTRCQFARITGGTVGADDITEAVECGRRAVDLVAAQDPHRAQYLTVLGNALRTRFEQSGDHTSLDESIAALRRAQGLLPAGDPRHVRLLVHKGRSLQARFAEGGDPRDADEALVGWQSAAANRTGAATDRAHAAESWGALAAFLGRTRSALDGYTAAVGLLPVAAWRGVGKTSLERLIADRSSLSGAAAACAMQAGEPETGVELLEQARGIMWAQLLEIRTDLTRLAERHPEVAARLERVRGALDRFAWPQGEG